MSGADKSDFFRSGNRCRAKGGELEQIQFLLGHESILTTERYLGSEQNLKNAVNDALVFE
jgi:integrase